MRVEHWSGNRVFAEMQLKAFDPERAKAWIRLITGLDPKDSVSIWF